MFRICIDPGHGEYGNPYPQRPGYYEGTQMYKLAQYQKEELEKYSDVEVILTRKSITDDPSLDARGKMAAGCDLFYSDHSNAADSSGNWSSARGVDIYGSNRKPAEDLCNQLGAAIAAAMGNSFRGTFYRDYQTGRTYSEPQPGMLDYYGVIRSAVATSCKAAIIVEHGFHTNELDSAFLINDDDLRKMAKAEVEVLARYYGLGSSGGDTPAPAPDSGDTYKVQPGDSLSLIGEKLGLDWREIASLNGISSPYIIYTGQVLKLPGSSSGGGTVVPSGDTYTVQPGDSLSLIGEKLGLDWREIASLNGISSPYIIYTGQVLKLPGSSSGGGTVVPSDSTYTVQTGDSLSAIGAKLGLDWREIASLNGISSPYIIYTGQILKLPGSSSGGGTSPTPPSDSTYTVQTGDSLSKIGAKLGINWREIASLNGISSPYIIYTGQVLKLPGGTGDTPDASQIPDTYTVQKGDSLYSIGSRLGVSWSALAVENSIAPPYIIYAGQVLKVPGGTAQVATAYAVAAQDTGEEGDADYQALYQSEKTAREAAENKLKALVDKISSLLSDV